MVTAAVTASSSTELLDRWLHRGEAGTADRLAIATRVGDRWDDMTYAGLDRRSAQMAARLAAVGVQPGDRVALLAPSGGDWTAAFLGILRRGAVAVPLDLKLTAEELATLCRRSRLAAAVVNAEKADGWPVPVPVLDPAEAGPEPEGAAGDATVDHGRSLDQPAILVWTSGTTGVPKGVTLSFANVAYTVSQASLVQGTGPDARWLSVLPPNHLLELCCGLLPALAAGSTTFVVRTIVPAELVALAEDAKVNQMVVVPMILRMLKRAIESQTGKPGLRAGFLRRLLAVAGAVPAPAARRLLLFPLHRRLGGRLRAFYCGGAPLDPDVAAFFDRLGIGVYAGYGLTEAAPTVAMNSPGHSRLGSVGRPLPGTEVRISAEGEILVRSPGVMLGYWEDEAATREAIDSDGWLHTGDLGRLDGDGFLFVTGRAKSLIVLDTGKKVQPEEVEMALSRSQLLSEACVVGWCPARGNGSGSAGGEQVYAVVVPTDAFAATHPDPVALEEAAADEVRRLTAGLSGFKRPTVVRVHLGELPKTPKRSVRQAEIVRLLEAREARR